MTAEEYLRSILSREAVDTGPFSTARSVQDALAPSIRKWAGEFLISILPSGSFAKGTANSSGTDIDLFISLSTRVPKSLGQIYESLFCRMGEEGFSPTRRNVSVQISVDGYKVDLTPGTLQNPNTDDHSIYRRKAYTWTKTNVRTHQAYVLDGGRTQETRLTKLWRDQHALDFPSFYLELVVIRALYGQYGSLPQNLFELFRYLVREFHDARFVDPANSNNVVSDDLTNAEKGLIVAGAEEALAATIWEEIVR